VEVETTIFWDVKPGSFIDMQRHVREIANSIFIPVVKDALLTEYAA
jgi:hypothetical protein